MKFILDELKTRKMLKQSTNSEKIKTAQLSSAGVYCGFDPTADSLHIGHLIQILNLKRFKDFGFTPLAIIGGGTGMIGDPSFKSSERNLLELEEVKKNSLMIKKQLETFIPEIKVIDNYDWLSKLSLIDFLRDIGKDFNLAYLLAKENISSRIEKGLSITEFSYTMLQGYDFYNLYKNETCWVQIGGSDQWGNITSGIDYIASKIGKENSKACGITMNLLTKKDGVKFGKTESGAIWLDPNKTSEYEFYQFFINQDDDDCATLLNYLTILSTETINTIMNDHNKEPHKRLAQKKLAEEVTLLVHGEKGLEKALKITETLFKGDINKLGDSELRQLSRSLPFKEINKGLNIIDFLVESQIATSKREARELISNNAITIGIINNFKESDVIDDSHVLIDNFIFVKKGKRRYFSIKLH